MCWGKQSMGRIAYKNVNERLKIYLPLLAE